MAVLLKNKELALVVETAGEKYTGCRFDWNGTVTSVKYKGLQILSQEKTPFHRNEKIFGRGLHNEFGIKKCIGYEEIPVGEWFPKIGTGWLKKDEKPYFFANSYVMEPLQFDFQVFSSSKVTFTCCSGLRNGYSYSYDKTIELDGSSFSITYELNNLGVKLINTTEYVHNFMLPGKKKVGTHLSLALPWDFNVSELDENVKTKGVVDFRHNGIGFVCKPSTEFFMGGIWQARSDKSVNCLGSWTLTDTKHNISITEKDSFVPCNCDVWGHSQNISPELFISLSVLPGEKITWNRTYVFAD